MELFGRSTGFGPVDEIAFWTKARKVEHADIGASIFKGRRGRIEVLPAGLVVVRQNDNIGAAQITGML
jgi:hypothetical protein